MGQDLGQNVHTVGFMLVDQFSMIALSACVEPLRLANYVTGQKLFAWRFYSKDREPVEASNGIRVTVEGSFAEIGPLPDVIVCGGIDIHRTVSRELLARLRRLALYGTSIGAVCTGAYALAKAGLLDGYRCTIHWEAKEALQEEFPELDVTDELFEVDRNRFTCAGGTAAIDMMLARIAAKAGPSVAALVTDNLIHHRQREPDEHQRMQLRSRLGIANPRVLQVVETMERHVEAPLSCAELARAAKLSPRQLDGCSAAISTKRRRAIISGCGSTRRGNCCCRPRCRSCRSGWPAALSRPRIFPRPIRISSTARPPRSARGSRRGGGVRRRAGWSRIWRWRRDCGGQPLRQHLRYRSGHRVLHRLRPDRRGNRQLDRLFRG